MLFRGTTAVLILVVFIGGMCPPLYEGLLPHDHLIIGGPPPADWESHHDHNLLPTLLDSIGSEGPVRTAEPAALGVVEIAAGETGKVVSLYAAPQVLVLSVFNLAILIPILCLVCSPGIHGPVGTDAVPLSSAEPTAPRPPPPRSRPDPVNHVTAPA